MRVYAPDGTWRVHGVRRAHERALAKLPQRRPHPAVGQEMHGAVRIPLKVSIAAKIVRETAQCDFRVDAPNDFPRPAVDERGLRQQRIGALPQDHPGALFDVEFGQRFRRGEI